ncbi:hypothetical protein FRC02_003816 [Tulasnella sp. 418]|nr:hypothetical protein FRC02_003816 [Tulasnella sp. 418]
MSNPPKASSLISPNAINRALGILLEDLESNREEWDIGEQTSTTSTRSDLLDREAKRLELALSAFQYQIRHDIAKIRHQRNKLAPIHRIPAELLQHIFLLKIPDYHALFSTSAIHDEYMDLRIYEGEKAGMDWREINIYPEIINMITACSRWYHLGLSMPQLWSCLDSRDSLDMTQAALGRSRHAPLHIWLLGDMNQYKRGEEFMNLVSPHLYRWRSLIILSPAFTLLRHLVIDSRSAPLLRKLVTHHSSETINVPQMIIQISPVLRDIHLGRVDRQFNLNSLSGLINLSLNHYGRREPGEITGEQLESILSSSPLLETIFLGPAVNSRGDLTPFSVTLSNLKSITLYVMEANPICTILSSIFTNQDNDFKVNIGRTFPASQGDVTATRNRHGSLIDIATKTITWILLVRSSGWMGFWRTIAGKEKLGVRSIILDTPYILFRSLYTGTSSSSPNLNGNLKITSMEIDWGLQFETDAMNGELHLYPYLEHLSISLNGYGQAKVQWIVQHVCFPSDEDNPQGLTLPQLKSLTLKGLNGLKILDNLVKARYGPSEVDLMSSPLFRGLARFTVHLVHPSDDDSKMELESYFRSRNVQFEVMGRTRVDIVI